MSKTPEILIPALRQYRHNYGGDEMVAAFDYDEVVAIINDLEPAVPVSELEELLIWLTTSKQVSTIGVAQHIEALLRKAKGGG